MNNLAYNSQDATYVGPRVEEKVREELAASGPLSYQVETGEAAAATIGSVLGDIGSALMGGTENMNEAAHPLLISSHLSRQNLQCHSTIELRMLRQIHFTHPARAELRADFVAV